MNSGPVHFEVFARRDARANWALQMATETREFAITTAEDLMKEGVAAVKVTKESPDHETGEFQSVTIFKAGAAEASPPAIMAPIRPHGI